jgi:hypothetical protein
MKIAEEATLPCSPLNQPLSLHQSLRDLDLQDRRLGVVEALFLFLVLGLVAVPVALHNLWLLVGKLWFRLLAELFEAGQI